MRTFAHVKFLSPIHIYNFPKKRLSQLAVICFPIRMLELPDKVKSNRTEPNIEHSYEIDKKKSTKPAGKILASFISIGV